MTTAAATGPIDADLAEALHGEMVPKFLATQDASGKPNVVPIISLDATDDRTMIFGELFMWKTRANLEADARVSAAVLTEDLRVWTMRGRFRGFIDTGPYLEEMNQKEIFRYNAYVRVSRVGIIDVEAVTGAWRRSTLGVAAELLTVMAMKPLIVRRGLGNPKTGERIPPRVSEKFARTHALKVIAYRGPEGHPEIAPAFSLLPASSQGMVFRARHDNAGLRALGPNTPIAASVITMDPIAYQVKGVYAGQQLTPAGRIGRIRVDEVYSASPPLPGEPIALQPPA